MDTDLESKIKKGFSNWDNDKDSIITGNDIRAVLEAALVPYSEEEISQLVSSLGSSSKDHGITWEAFLEAYVRKHRRDNNDHPENPLMDMERNFSRKKRSI